MKKKKKGSFNGFMPMFQGGALPMPPMPPVPPMPFAPFGNVWGTAPKGKGKEDEDSDKENFKSAVESFMSQNIEMQKTSFENQKNQWAQFFDYMMEMEETFVASMPDDLSFLPFLQYLPMSPKEVMEQMKEYRQMANDHFVEQADSFADFYIQRKQKISDMVSKSMENAEAAENDVEEVKDSKEAASENK